MTYNVFGGTLNLTNYSAIIVLVSRADMTEALYPCGHLLPINERSVTASVKCRLQL